MTDMANNVFWLADILKIFFSEATGQSWLWYCRNVH
jgi:hypothetical protein